MVSDIVNITLEDQNWYKRTFVEYTLFGDHVNHGNDCFACQVISQDGLLFPMPYLEFLVRLFPG